MKILLSLFGSKKPISLTILLFMAKAWCYQCEKTIVPTSDGLCPICGADFIEYGNEDFNPEAPQPARPAPTEPIQNQQRQRVGPIQIGFTFTPAGFAQGFLNGILGGRNDQNNQNQQNAGNTLVDIFQNTMNMFLGPLIGENPMGQNGDGRQMGDFFFGNEEQFQALAERLFQLNQQSLGSPPVSEEFRNGLQAVHYKEGCCVEDTCSICLETFKEDEEIVILPCKHGYHRDCLDPWLKMHSECPSCRAKLPTDN